MQYLDDGVSATIKPGDVLLLKIPGLMSTMKTDAGLKMIEEWKQTYKRFLPEGVEVILIDKEIDAIIMRREEAPK